VKRRKMEDGVVEWRSNGRWRKWKNRGKRDRAKNKLKEEL
jgi:hypothetical protein